MTFDIIPFPITQTAISLRIRIKDSNETTCTIYYELFRADGRIVETGVKTFPIEALAIIAQKPINKAALNVLLSEWNLEAV